MAWAQWLAQGRGPSLAREMPGSLLAAAESSFFAEAAELEGLSVRQCLCRLRQESGWQEAELKGGGRWHARDSSDPAAAFWGRESDVPFSLCPSSPGISVTYN